MGVQLNIKDETTVRLARELADASGVSVTAAIRSALEQAAAQREAAIQARIAEFDAIVADFQAHMPDDWRGRSSKEIMDDLYDDDGLPR